MKTNEGKKVVPDIAPIEVIRTRSKRINQYDLQGHYLRTFDSISQAQKELNIIGVGIYRAISGKAKTCKGFQWRLAQ